MTSEDIAVCRLVSETDKALTKDDWKKQSKLVAYRHTGTYFTFFKINSYGTLDKQRLRQLPLTSGKSFQVPKFSVAPDRPGCPYMFIPADIFTQI